MQRKWVLSLAVATSIIVLGLAMAGFAPTEGRSPGIAPQRWHPLSETTGIVLREQHTVSGPMELRGTLMIRRDQQWRAAYLERGDATVVPAQ